MIAAMIPTLEPFVDHSEPCEIAPGGPLSLYFVGGAPRGERLAGSIAAIEPLQRDAREQVFKLTIRGAKAAVGLRMPAQASPPLAIGEVVEVAVTSRVLGIHPVSDFVASVGGALRVAGSGRGDPAWIPGWTVAVAKIAGVPPADARGMAVRLELPVLLGHRGRTAAVGGNGWRRLVTDDGAWLLTGNAVAYSPGMLVPGASTYHAYGLLRAVG